MTRFNQLECFISVHHDYTIQIQNFFVSFCPFHIDNYSTNMTLNDKSIDGVLGTQTQGGRMVGA